MLRIQAFEKQSGLIRMLVFLSDRDEYTLSKIWEEANIGTNQGYRSLNKAQKLGLIASRIDNSSYPPKNMISLTPKGKKVAELLKKIEEVLEG
ncbi:MAG: hypothetical protein JRN68_04755 [Nitrososphaerota archaeon]|nr:hypothetical protein [Nitrososphaerota archaeon]